MSGLVKRVRELEGEPPRSNWEGILDAMSSEELVRLEGLVAPGLSVDLINGLSDDDAAFLSGLLQMRNRRL